MKKWIAAACVLTAAALTACSPTTTPPTLEAQTESVEETETETEDPYTEMAFIFRVKDGVFERVTLFLMDLEPQTITDKLIEFGVLEEGTEVLSFNIEGDMGAGPGNPAGPGAAGPGTGAASEGAVIAEPPAERILTLNLSKIPQWPADSEALMLRCLGDTFVDNYQAKVKLLINGENYSGATITLGDEDYLDYESGYVNVSE